jgi:hypothetical protein
MEAKQVAQFSLLAVSADAKTVKGQAQGYLTGILYMLPAEGQGDGQNLCPFATPGCRQSCLNTAGRGMFSSVQQGRARKRAWFLRDRAGFIAQLERDIEQLARRAARLGLIPVVRLNGTTDLVWERIAPELFAQFPGIQFYDYTKISRRLEADWVRPANYHLTFSRSECNDAESARILGAGRGTVAVVFATRKGQALPATWQGVPVIDGDQSDLRFLEPQGVVVGLRAKGRAKLDTTGFVVPATEAA